MKFVLVVQTAIDTGTRTEAFGPYEDDGAGPKTQELMNKAWRNSDVMAVYPLPMRDLEEL